MRSEMKRTRIAPPPIRGGITAAELIERNFLGYNAARLSEACRLYVSRILQPEVTVGVTLTGALTPAGLGISALIPLVEAGFIDWMISTGANLYHDMHFGLNYELHQASPFLDDVELRRRGIIRIYDIVFDAQVLFDTDQFLYRVLQQPECQRKMGTAELHWILGKYMAERERALGLPARSLLAACHRCDVPIYTSSPGDSTIGMNAAALSLLPAGSRFDFDVSLDVNETTAIVWNAKRRRGGKSAILILGGGSPKNFALQTEPQIQEILGLKEAGHDFFIQFTDARPDTGGLSGATPSEAVSWGKIDPDQLPHTVVCYTDSTIALPLLAAHALTRAKPRPLRRLYRQRAALLEQLRRDYHRSLRRRPRRTDWPKGRKEPKRRRG